MLTETLTRRILGQVKWFNNKAGYGFITVIEGDHTGKDIFVHYSTIVASSNAYYKYLIQGEYVEFILENSTSETHEFQANDVTGVRKGNLMCDMRSLNRPPVDENAEYIRNENRSRSKHRTKVASA